MILQTMLVVVAAAIFCAGLAAFAMRRALPRALFGALVAGVVAAVAALGVDAPLAALALAILFTVVALALGAAHLRHRDRAGPEAARPSRPGLVLAAFLLLPCLALFGGVVGQEPPGASAEGVAARPLDELLAGLLGLAVLAALIALTAASRGDDA